MDSREKVYSDYYSSRNLENERDDKLLSDIVENRSKILKMIDNFYKYFSTTRCKVYDSHRHTLTAYRYTVWGYDSNTPIRIKFIIWFIFYMNIKFIALNLLYYIKIFSSNQWSPRVKDNATRTKYCALKDDIYGYEGEALEWILFYQTIISYFGFTSTSLSPAWITYSNLSLIYFLSEYFFRWIRLNRPIFNNSLTFLNHPVEERQRVKEQLSEIVEELAICSNDLPNIFGCTCKGKLVWKGKQLARLIEDQYPVLSRLPNYLSPKIYKEVLRLTIFFHISSLIMQFTFLFQLMFSWVNFEVESVIEQRIREINCKHWNSNATVIEDPYLSNYFRSNEAKRERQLIELAGDMVPSSVYTLVTLRVLTIYTSSYLIESFLICQIAICTVVEEAVNRYINIYSLKVLIEQVYEQLEGCKAKMSSMNVFDSNKIASLDEALLVAYVNLELFYREYREPYLLIGTTTNKFMIQNISLFVTGYSFSLYTSSSSLTVMFSIMSLLFFNYDSYLALTVTNRARRAFKLLNEVIGQVSSLRTRQSCTLRLLRRHLLSDEDVQELFAIRFLGLKLTQRTIISIDTYVIGGILFMIQVHFMSK